MRTFLWIAFGLGAAGFAYLIWTDTRQRNPSTENVAPTGVHRSARHVMAEAEIVEFSEEARRALIETDSAKTPATVPSDRASGGANPDSRSEAGAIARLTAMVEILNRTCPSRFNAGELLIEVRIDVDGFVRQVSFVGSETKETSTKRASAFARAFVAERRPMLLEAYRTKLGIFRNAREAGRGMRFDYSDRNGLRLAAIELRPEEL